MTEIIKKYRAKIAGYGTVAVLIGGLLWSYQIGPKALAALSRLPVLEVTVAAQDKTDANMVSELKEAETERKGQAKEIAALLAEMRLVLDDMKTAQTDIKRLLER